MLPEKGRPKMKTVDKQKLIDALERIEARTLVCHSTNALLVDALHRRSEGNVPPGYKDEDGEVDEKRDASNYAQSDLFMACRDWVLLRRRLIEKGGA